MRLRQASEDLANRDSFNGYIWCNYDILLSKIDVLYILDKVFKSIIPLVQTLDQLCQILTLENGKYTNAQEVGSAGGNTLQPTGGLGNETCHCTKISVTESGSSWTTNIGSTSTLEGESQWTLEGKTS